MPQQICWRLPAGRRPEPDSALALAIARGDALRTLEPELEGNPLAPLEPPAERETEPVGGRCVVVKRFAQRPSSSSPNTSRARDCPDRRLPSTVSRCDSENAKPTSGVPVQRSSKSAKP